MTDTIREAYHHGHNDGLETSQENWKGNSYPIGTTNYMAYTEGWDDAISEMEEILRNA